MRITVRSIARLGAQVPAGRRGNWIELEVAPQATPADVVRALGLSADRGYLVLVNGQVVPEAQHARTALSDSDEVTILPKPKVG